MTALTRRAALASLGAGAAMLPSLPANASGADLEAQIHDLIAELRSDDPGRDLWHFADPATGHENKWFTHGQHRTFGNVADRLQAMIGGAS